MRHQKTEERRCQKRNHQDKSIVIVISPINAVARGSKFDSWGTTWYKLRQSLVLTDKVAWHRLWGLSEMNPLKCSFKIEPRLLALALLLATFSIRFTAGAKLDAAPTYGGVFFFRVPPSPKPRIFQPLGITTSRLQELLSLWSPYFHSFVLRLIWFYMEGYRLSR